MKHDITSIASEELATVTGGGWKGKVAKAAWEAAKWTGIPSAIGGGAAWAKHKFFGPDQPQAQPPKP